MTKVHTLFIYSADRTRGTAADYYVQLPQINDIGDGQYDLYLDSIAGRLLLVGTQGDVSVATGGTTGFIQVALDISAPNAVTTGSSPTVKWIVPVNGGTAIGYTLGPWSRSPINISGSSFNSCIHVQLYDDDGLLIVPGAHEHVITLTIRQR
jgi:hypothetical protein